MSLDLTAARKSVETAFENFGSGRRLAEANEAETRVALIDRILVAMGWDTDHLPREVASQTGDWLDYELRIDGEAWMVVEAKRVGETFALDVRDRRVLAIATLQRRGASMRSALKQAASYCNDRAVPFAAVTNGYQWVFFRGLSRADAPWPRERAVVFDGPSEILEGFDEFASCLSRPLAGKPALPRMLSFPTSAEVPTAMIPRDFLRLRHTPTHAGQTGEMQAATRLLFGEIHGSDRLEMLRRCYVSPGNEADFTRSIKSLLKDSAQSIAGVEDKLEGDTADFVGRITGQELAEGFEYPVVVTGHVGAGKTTFIHRSLEHFRDAASDLFRQAFYAYVDLEGLVHGGSIDARREEERVAEAILERLGNSAVQVLKHASQERRSVRESEVEQGDPYAPVTLKTLFREEIERERRLGRDVWDANDENWKRKEYEIISGKAADHVDLLFAFVRHLRARFLREDQTRYPALIVLDNLDQGSDQYQRCIYGLAWRLAKATPAIIVVTLREDTYHRGLTDDGFLSTNPLEFVFHVAAPPLDRVLRRRTAFAESVIDGEVEGEAGALRALTKNSTEVRALIDVTRSAFLQRRNQGAELVASLAGHNTRSALRLVRLAAMGSVRIPHKPDGSAEFVLESLMVAQSFSAVEGTAGIRKLLDATPHAPPMHHLRLRILAYLSWARETGHRHALLESTEEIVARFAAWGYPPEVVETEIRELLREELLAPRGADWRIESGTLPTRAGLTALGEEHRSVIIHLKSFRALMACVCRWYDPELAKEFIERATAAGSDDGTSLSDLAISTAPELYDAYLRTTLVAEEAFLSPGYRDVEWVREVLSRSHIFVPQHFEIPDRTTPDRESVRSASPQQSLLPELQDQVPTPKLRRIPRTLSYRNTVWIPRVLWALEWARVDGRGAQSASDLARILVGFGDIDVPATNVARAFREMREEQRANGLWETHGKRYVISETGTQLIRALVADVLEEEPA